MDLLCSLANVVVVGFVLRISVYPPHPPSSLSEVYRSPPYEPHQFYRNPLEPPTSYCEFYCCGEKSSVLSSSEPCWIMYLFLSFFDSQIIIWPSPVLFTQHTGMFHLGAPFLHITETTVLTVSRARVASRTLSKHLYTSFFFFFELDTFIWSH